MLVTRFVLAIAASLLLAGHWADGASAQDGAGASIVTQTGHMFIVNTVAFSPDGHTALSGGMDSTLRLWDVARGRQLRFFSGHSSNVTSAAFFPHGRTAISGGWDNNLRLWDVDTGRELRIFKGHTAPISSLAVSKDGRTVLSGSKDMTLKLWDASTGEELRTFKGHSGKVTAMALSPDGRTVVSGSEDNSLKLWDISTGGEPRTFASGTVGITSLAFSPDGRTVLCGQMNVKAIQSRQFTMFGSAEPLLSLWDASTGRKLRTLPGDMVAVYAVAFSPDGRIAATGGGMDFKLWDTATWNPLRKSAESYNVSAKSLAFSADGRTILIGGLSSLKIWDIAAEKTRLNFQGHHDTGEESSLPYLSPETLPSGSTYEADRREKLAERKAQRKGTGYTPWVHSVGVSPDGRTLLAGNNDSMLRLWDLTTGRLLRTFQGRGDEV